MRNPKPSPEESRRDLLILLLGQDRVGNFIADPSRDESNPGAVET